MGEVSDRGNARAAPPGPPYRGAVVDIDTGELRRDSVLMLNTRDGGFVSLAMGARAERLSHFAFHDASDPHPLFTRCRRIERALNNGDLAKARVLGLPKSFGRIEDARLRRLAIVEVLAKAGLNPDEPRDRQGRWTAGGGNDEGLDAAASLFGAIAPEVIGALSELGAGFSAATAFLGVIFVPTNASTVISGTLPGFPDTTYDFDRDTGTLRLSRNGEVLFEGDAGQDGRFHSADGSVYGREVDGSLVLDPDALPEKASPATSTAQSGSAAEARDKDERDEPKLCPAPSDDWPGAREKDKAYEAVVGTLVNGEPLDPNLAVRLPKAGLDHPPDPDNPLDYVYFDNCRLSDGTMIEAKGTGYQAMLDKTTDYPWDGVQAGMVDQARRQLAAANGRAISWYFAEEGVADYMRDLFGRYGYRIDVIYAPP